MVDILEDPSYNAIEEDQDKPRQNGRGSLVEQVEDRDEPRRNYRGSLVEQAEIAETPGVMPGNKEPEHEILFEDNKYDPDIEPPFDNLKDKESNIETWFFK